MSDDLNERVAIVEQVAASAHKRIDDVEAKKLSKHEFNGHVNVMDNFKTMFSAQFEKHDRSIEENTEGQKILSTAMTKLETSFENASRFLPVLIRVIFYCSAVIIGLLGFIATKLFHVW